MSHMNTYSQLHSTSRESANTLPKGNPFLISVSWKSKLVHAFLTSLHAYTCIRKTLGHTSCFITDAATVASRRGCKARQAELILAKNERKKATTTPGSRPTTTFRNYCQQYHSFYTVIYWPMNFICSLTAVYELRGGLLPLWQD